MTTATRLPPVLLLAVVLHTAVLPELRVFGVAADLLLLVGIVAGIASGADRGAAVGFVAGLLADCFLQTPFGLSALAYSLVGYGVGAFQSTILHTGRWIPVLTAMVASALGVLTFAAIGSVLGQDQLVSARLATVAGVVAVFNGLLCWPVLRVMRWAIAPSLVARTALR
ncbi:MAG: rod shape-determining protein MreD [Acidimicrobiales bacterium]